MIPPFDSLKFIDYNIVDEGINLHFLATGSLPGTVTDYYILLSNVEINSALNTAQIDKIIQQKVNRLYNGVGIASILDSEINSVFVPANPAGIPAYFTDPIIGPQSLMSSISPNSIGTELAAISPVAPVSTAWSNANMARGVPLTIQKPVTVQKLFVYNGATVAGNFDIGIYSEGGNLIISSGSTPQAGINILQEVNLNPNIVLGSGRYYMVLVADTTTATFFATAVTTQICKLVGLFQNGLSFPLPSSIGIGAYAATFVPIFGLSTRSRVV